MSITQPIIRAARANEHALLSELSLRSKGHWGYDSAFLEACRKELTISPRFIKETWVFVIEVAGRVAGFYSLAKENEQVDLNNLFVEPAYIGHGYGKQLWLHAVKNATQQGFKLMTIEADPYAKLFYEAMGAKVVDEAPSNSVSGRMLPLLHYRFPP
ncbi:GNAT family N-acetyltransferase [Anaerolineales bacterium HSG25]|nr:GNAT family N-acetyltransferase [Anaerolineales bacterium HSG25]